MNILVACEESQEVTKEFRKKGHNAFSCDIQLQSGGHPEWHIKDDVIPLIKDSDCWHEFTTVNGDRHIIDKWDMIIAFPPCTDLASSGAAWFAEKRKDGRQQRSIEFFMEFTKTNCEKVIIENPIGIMSKLYRKPDQIIQPWWFGEKVGKSTCLWLKGVEKLPQEITERPEPEYFYYPNGKRQEMWFYKTLNLPKEERARARSKTFHEVARAMAQYWG